MSEIIEALNQLEKERNISKDVLLEAMRDHSRQPARRISIQTRTLQFHWTERLVSAMYMQPKRLLRKLRILHAR